MISLRVMIADIELNPREALCRSLRVDDKLQLGWTAAYAGAIKY